MGKESKQAAADRRAKIAQARKAEQAAARRRKLMNIGVGGVVVVALVGGGVALAMAKGKDKSPSSTPTAAAGDVQAVLDTNPADADKSGIDGIRTYKVTNRNHVQTSVNYGVNPPVGGNHDPEWQECDGKVYDKPLRNENAVHALEHGSVWVTYLPGTSAADLKTLSDKVSQTPYSLMSPYPNQPGQIELTAWGKQLSVTSASDPRVNEFFKDFVQGPQTPEPGATCSGGKTTP